MDWPFFRSIFIGAVFLLAFFQNAAFSEQNKAKTVGVYINGSNSGDFDSTDEDIALLFQEKIFPKGMHFLHSTGARSKGLAIDAEHSAYKLEPKTGFIEAQPSQLWKLANNSKLPKGATIEAATFEKISDFRDSYLPV